MSDIRLGIIGAGSISIEHLKVITAMKGVRAAGVTSRTLSKAAGLANTFQIDQVYDSVTDMVKKCAPDGILILVSANQIYEVALKLLPESIPLFLEKPPGLIPQQTKSLAKLAGSHGTQNMVGFNRRYYSVFQKGLAVIKDHGALLGVAIEGHERFWKIAGTNIPDEIRQNWIYANSIHTIDLLQYFGGKIRSINAHSKSYKEKNGDQLVASIEFDSGSIGTYTSHWYSPGGWSATLYGEGITVKFKPLEKGVWIDTEFKKYEINPDEVDIKYKPGFYLQMKAFVSLIKSGSLEPPGINVEEALETMKLTEKFC